MVQKLARWAWEEHDFRKRRAWMLGYFGPTGELGVWKECGKRSNGKGLYQCFAISPEGNRSQWGNEIKRVEQQPSIFTFTTTKYRDGGVDRKREVGGSERISGNWSWECDKGNADVKDTNADHRDVQWTGRGSIWMGKKTLKQFLTLYFWQQHDGLIHNIKN